MQTIVKNIDDYRPAQNQIVATPITSPEDTRTLIRNNDSNSTFFRRLEDSGICLNKQQLEILTCNEKNVVVNSLPGSGKTSCLVALLAFLTQVKAVPQQNIIALAYSKKAALEMQERLLRLDPDNCVPIFTFHALCLRILRSNNGFDKHKILTDDRVRLGIMKSCQKSIQSVDHLPPEDLLALCTYHVNTLTEPADEEMRRVLSQYRKIKQQHKLLDFDDLLIDTLRLLQCNPRLLNLLQQRFMFICQDECQDLNPLQYAILKLLAAKSRLYCIGDKNQSIFGFVGSSPTIMDKIVQEFAAKELSLHVSYRCSALNLGFAHKILGSNEPIAAVKMGTKSLLVRPYDRAAEAKFIVQKISNTVSTGKRHFRDFAILFRSVTASSALIGELLEENIPFRSNNSIAMPYSDNISLFFLRHLRLILDRSDVSALQGILPTFYLSKGTVMSFLNPYLKSQDKGSGIDLLRILQDLPGLKEYQSELLGRRIYLLDQLKRKTPTEAFNALIRDKDIKKRLGLPNLSPAANKEVINEITNRLLEGASQYTSIKDYLYHVDDLRSKYLEHQKNKRSEDDAVQLMSIHSSKGLQFPCVIIIGAVEGMLPHQRVLDTAFSFSADILATSQMNGSHEEERRLLYVAVTRAEHELTISAPMNNNGNLSKISRFLAPFENEFVSVPE